jgi:hypothetical protein
MSEQWLTLILGEDEKLSCDTCAKWIQDQIAYLCRNDNAELDEILCETCWKRNQTREE